MANDDIYDLEEDRVAVIPNGDVGAGGSFAITQFLVSNFHGPWLVDVVIDNVR